MHKQMEVALVPVELERQQQHFLPAVAVAAAVFVAVLSWQRVTESKAAGAAVEPQRKH
jgi:hypothetical protein